MTTEIKNSIKEILCRGCLVQIDNTVEKVDLFGNFVEDDAKSFEFHTISDMFTKYTSIQIQMIDEYPPYLCTKCYQSLENFHTFCKISIASNIELIKRETFANVGDNSNNDIYVKKEYNDIDNDEFNVNDESVFCQFEVFSPSNDIVEHSHVDVKTKENASERSKVRDVRSPEQQQTDTKEKNNKDTKIKCTMCDKVFNKQQQYEEHFRTHMGVNQYKCDVCEREFCKRASLRRHKNNKHAETKKEFICGVDNCGKSYSIKESLRRHISIIHLNQRETKPKTRKMVCEQCGKAFHSTSGLLRHSYSHSGLSPFKCHICLKQYPTKYKLKEHLMRHDGEKPHVCPTCGLRKTTMHELRVHINYHTRAKTFPCTMCSLILPTGHRLTKHMKVVHYGIKEYHCTHCDRSFGKPNTLKYHIMTHTGEKPHVCSVCEKRFIQPVALRTHMKTHKN